MCSSFIMTFLRFNDWDSTQYFWGRWILVSRCLCVCVCASTCESVLSILFFNILPDGACFCGAHNALDRLLQGTVCSDAISLFLDHVCTQRPRSPGNKVGSLFLRALGIAVSTEHKASLPTHIALGGRLDVYSCQVGISIATKSWCYL